MTPEQHQTLFDKLHDIEAVTLEIKAMLALKPAASAAQVRAEDRVAAMSCPKCAGPMQLRTAKASGKQFAGCRGYPACDGIRWLSGDVPPDRAASTTVKKPAPTAPSEGPGPEESDVPF